MTYKCWINSNPYTQNYSIPICRDANKMLKTCVIWPTIYHYQKKCV